MPPTPDSARSRPPSQRRTRLALMLLLVALLHIGMIAWLRHALQLAVGPAEAETDPIALSISLLAPEEPAEVPAEPPATPEAAVTPPSDAPAIAAVPLAPDQPPVPAEPELPAPPEPETSSAAEAPPPDPAPEAAPDISVPSLTAAGDTEPVADPLAQDTPAAETPSTLVPSMPDEPAAAHAETDAEDPPRPPAPALFARSSPPPSAALSYRVLGIRNGRSIEGSGMMRWHADGDHYRLTTDISVLFFTLLKSRSEGELGTLGIAPLVYAEKRIGRSETNTHFHRERRQISFSASTAVFPVEGGEQDRSSWIWQLAALGRGDPDKFAPGLVFEIVIAGTKSADRWRVYVNGRDNLDLPGGPVSAWRLSVIPGPDSFERQFELWLAPQQDWYPVRLRHEDRNGNSIDMQLKNIVVEPPAVQAGEAGQDAESRTED